MSKKKNASAFPQLTWECPQGATTAFHFTRGGLSKRELFAAMAMQGLLSNLAALRKEGFSDSDIEEFAVIRADGLLRELESTDGL